PRLSALNEDKEHLATTIDKCQKDLSYYQIQTEIDLMAKARYLLQERNYRLRTDGRRIKTKSPIHHQSNDDVSSDESGYDTSSDGSSHKCKHAMWNQP
ncbi:hypothetical protein Gotri_018994, partial [Gossypium trilobum]|nr:hypothetical protein [Gossypium trilobum]